MNDWEDQPNNKPVYRNGFVHVNGAQCVTCVYRPGNLMHLAPGALQTIITENHAKNTALVCHENIDGDHPGVCHGFWRTHPTMVLRLAQAIGALNFQTVEGVVVGNNTTTTLPGEIDEGIQSLRP